MLHDKMMFKIQLLCVIIKVRKNTFMGIIRRHNPYFMVIANGAYFERSPWNRFDCFVEHVCGASTFFGICSFFAATSLNIFTALTFCSVRMSFIGQEYEHMQSNLTVFFVSMS